VLGLIYGVPVFGFALLWTALAATMTIRTARTHLPFALTWWSFTFPVGTLVTGTSALAARTGSVPIIWMAVAFYVGLVAGWVVVALRTAHGSARGYLFLPAAPLAP
jgi:tellurite resistance protein TehA-like permease